MISPGVNKLGKETDYTTPSSVEVKNDGTIPPLPLISWHNN
jgi:hypothetical protein